MKKYPTLKSARITLNQPVVADIPNIIQYAGHEKVAATTLNMPHPYYEKDAIFWLNMANQSFQDQSKYIFAVRLNTTNELIGGMGLHIETRFNRAELGYWIGLPFWNKGYATEAAKVVLQFGFDQLKLNKIYATHITGNPASGKVMSKNKMLKEGELKEHIKKGDSYHDLVQYRLTRQEFEANQALK